MTTNDGGPAFPQPKGEGTKNCIGHHTLPGGDSQLICWVRGMSLRDWFAGMAMVGKLANPEFGEGPHELVKAVYMYADAMLAECKEQDTTDKKDAENDT